MVFIYINGIYLEWLYNSHFWCLLKNRYYPVEYIKKGHDTHDTKADKA